MVSIASTWSEHLVHIVVLTGRSPSLDPANHCCRMARDAVDEKRGEPLLEKDGRPGSQMGNRLTLVLPSLPCQGTAQLPELFHCSAQCVVCTVSFPCNRTSWDMTSHLTIVISFNIFSSQLVRLRGKHFYERFRELQTLNLRFSPNYTPVATTGFWRFLSQSLSKYMAILLSPRIIHRGILLYKQHIVQCSQINSGKAGGDLLQLYETCPQTDRKVSVTVHQKNLTPFVAFWKVSTPFVHFEKPKPASIQ